MKKRLILIYMAIALFLVLLPLSVQAAKSEGDCEHTFGDWVLTVVPDCTQTGKAERTCTACGHVETITVTRPGHIPSDWILESAPEIGVAGSMHRICTVCGETIETEALAPLPEPETEPETEPEPTPEPENNWIEIPFPVVLIIGLLPNAILVIVLIVRKLGRRMNKS